MDIHHDDIQIPFGPKDGQAGKSPNAYWVPAEHPDAPVFLYLHGQDATRGKNLDHTDRFHQWGWNVLVIDYRGFAETYDDQSTSESNVYEDALDALNYLIHTREIPPHRIFIYGHSLGGAVAIELATKKEALATAGLIVESTFTSILDMSEVRYNGFLNLLPIDLLLTERFDSASKINSIELPILIIHGTKDPKVPHQMSVELHKRAGDQATLCLIENAGHEDCGSIGKKQYRQFLDEFVAKCLQRKK